MIKIIVIAVVLLIGLGFIAPGIVSSFKNKTIEAVNPSAKERRILGAYSDSINKFQEELQGEEFKRLPPDVQASKMNQFLEESASIVKEMDEINKDGNIQSSIGNLIRKLIPDNESNDPSSACKIPLEN